MIIVSKLIPGGYGLGTHPDGRKIFFWNALPGEVITDFNITKQKTHFYEAIATQHENLSPHRVLPRDPCYLSTSPWQIMDYNYELNTKQELVVEIFREHHIDISTPEIFTDGNQYYYRNKMEYALYWHKENANISLAFHARGSHRKLPITQSSLERPELFNRAQAIIDDLNYRHEEARKYQSLLLRCNQAGQVSGGLYENHHPHPTFPLLTDQILGKNYSYSPNGFFQINLPVYELALREIKKHIVTEQVLDLYAGVGTIGLSVAADHNLTLVEVDQSAAKELENNCRSSKGNIRAVRARSEDVLSFITPGQTIILDPPRAGCARELINHLLSIRPAKIIYLSCNPATQARDISLLLPAYHIDIVQTFNFFPRTPHIENLVILSRK